jgi:hypothetical protein
MDPSTEDLAQPEEEPWDRDPEVRAEIREARAAYDAGDYLTIDEYLAQGEADQRSLSCQ